MADRSVNINTVGFWTLNRIKYPTGGASVIEMEADAEGGGLRIHRQYDLTGMGDTTNVRTYSYERETFVSPSHVDYYTSRYYALDPPHTLTECSYNTYSASSVAPVMLMDGPDYGYYEVSVEFGNNGEFGKTVSRFSRGYHELDGDQVGVSLNALAWGRGELLSKTHYQRSGTTFQPVQRELHGHRVYFNDENGMWDDPDKHFESYIYGLQIDLNAAELKNGSTLIEAADFDVNKYRIVSAWHHPNTVQTQIYDPISSVWRTQNETVTEFDTTNARLASIEQINTNGQSKTTSFAYGVTGKPSKLTSVSERDGNNVLLRKRTATWSTSLGSGRAELYRIYDYKSESSSNLIAEYPSYDLWGNPLVSIGALGDTTRYFYGSNTSAFSQSGISGVKGKYVTGIQHILGTADAASGGVRPMSGNDLFSEARYDSLGRIVQMIDANVKHVYFNYDALHRLIGVYNHANEIVSANEYAYVGPSLSSSNPNWIRTTNHLTSSASTVTTGYYDGLGRPIQTHLREGSNDNVTATGYDGLGRPDKTWSTYLQSNSSHIYRPSFATEAAAYYDGSPGPNAFGRPYVQTAYEASPLGRPIRSYPQKTSSTLDSVQTNYGLASYGGVLYNLTETIDESGKKSRTYSDGWGRRIVTTAAFGTPDSASTKFEYDLLGRLTKVTSPEGRLTHYRYDLLGRMTAKTTPDADGDGNGNPANETGISTSVDFEYAYDNAGNLTAMRDPNRKAASEFVFTRFDSLGRKTAEGICASSWPTGCAAGDSTSQVIEYTWDDAGIGSGVSFTINHAKGRQTKVAFQGGYYLYSYNADGHIERMYTKLDGLAGKTVAYTYDRQGNQTASLYQSGQSDLFRHVYTYDVAGRLNLVRGNNHATTQITEGTYTWWPDGGMKTELLRNQTNTFAYDARGRLTAINNTASTSTKFSASYVWNPNSTLQISEYRQEGTIHTDKRYRHSFTYDGRNQLRTADYMYHNGSTWADRYDFDIGWIGYDRDGGITLMNRQNGSEVVDFEYANVSGSHRLDYVLNNENYDIDDISHDRNGNITNGIGIDTTTYDWRNLPLSITVYNTDYPFIPSTYTHTYRYDHNGHRVYSSVDQTYSVRGAYGEPIAEYAGSTPVLKYWNYVRPDGVVIGRREGSNRFFYHRDHLGSTRTVLNASSTMVEVFDYMPFGEFMSGRITTSGNGTRPKYTGHAFDDETDLHNMQWRRQIPRYGVFRTPDPMADSYPGWNPYAYVMNDPMRYLDPTGLASCEFGFKGTCLPEVVVTADRYDGFLAYKYSFYANNYYDPHYTPTQRVTPDQFMTAMDVAGTVDPTGALDLAAATIYAFQGDFVNASISAASILPAGDLLKASRIATKGAVKNHDSLEDVAKQLYPKKAGRDELHHITPKYLGGSASGPVVKLNAAYHQLIANAFRAEWGYGLRNPTNAQLESIMKKVYSQYPLP